MRFKRFFLVCLCFHQYPKLGKVGVDCMKYYRKVDLLGSLLYVLKDGTGVLTKVSLTMKLFNYRHPLLFLLITAFQRLTVIIVTINRKGKSGSFLWNPLTFIRAFTKLFFLCGCAVRPVESWFPDQSLTHPWQ